MTDTRDNNNNISFSYKKNEKKNSISIKIIQLNDPFIKTLCENL